MKTVVFANQKGGVGKSATVCLLAHYLAQRGQRVLVIDFDHQGNTSKALLTSGRVDLAGIAASQVLTTQQTEVGPGAFVLATADGTALLGLERQPERHNQFAGNFRSFLKRVADRFDVCVIDTNPNPDIRVVAALVSADFVVSPVQLNQEAIDGIAALLGHERVGIQRIQARLNPGLKLVGILPTLVEPTPFQKRNFAKLVQHYASLLIKLPGTGFALVPKRSAIAEAQAAGEVLWEMKKTAAREAWKEIEPGMAQIAHLMGLDVMQAAARQVV
jgi:chromosome partitioning protein